MMFQHGRASVIILAIVWSFSSLGCTNDNAAKQSFFGEKLDCPPPAIAEFGSWGQHGSQHVCKITHGPFVAFEEGHVRLRGQYDNGREVGTWRWYGTDGKVEIEVTYPATVEGGAQSTK